MHRTGFIKTVSLLWTKSPICTMISRLLKTLKSLQAKKKKERERVSTFHQQFPPNTQKLDKNIVQSKNNNNNNNKNKQTITVKKSKLPVCWNFEPVTDSLLSSPYISLFSLLFSLFVLCLLLEVNTAGNSTLHTYQKTMAVVTSRLLTEVRTRITLVRYPGKPPI